MENTTIEILEQELKLSIDNYGEYHIETSNVNDNLGDAYSDKGDYEQAIKYYEKSLKIQIKIFGEERPYSAITYNAIGIAYYNKCDYERAIEFHEKALAIQLKNLGEEHPAIAETYCLIGDTYYKNSNYNQALEYYKKALALQLKNFKEGHSNITDIFNVIGIVHSKKGDYDQAIKYHKNILDIDLKKLSENHPNITVPLIINTLQYVMIGDLYFKKGDYYRAITYYEKALVVQLKNFGEEHSDIALSYNNLGAAYSEKGDYNQAITYYNKAINAQLKEPNEKYLDIALIYFNLGAAYDKKGNYDQANVYYEKWIEIKLKKLGKELPDERNPDIAKQHNIIGAVYFKKGDYNRAIEYYEKALAIQLKNFGEEHPDTVRMYYDLGAAYSEKGNYNQAVLYMEKALSIASKIKYLYLAPFVILGFCYYFSKKYIKAKDIFLEGILLLEESLKNIGSSKIFVLQENIYLYYHLIQICSTIKDLSCAFYTAERMRAHGFINRMAIRTAVSVKGIAAEDSQKLLKLNDEIETLVMKRNREIEKPLVEKDKEGLFQISILIEEKEKERDSLHTRLLANDRFKELSEFKYATLKEAQNLCGKRSAILEYVIPNGIKLAISSYCLIIKQNDVCLVKIAWDDACVKAVKDCVPDDFQKFVNLKRTTKFLYSRLIKPLEEELEEIDDLLISPDGPLAFLAFDILTNSDDKYLIEKYTISLIPSVSVISMIKKRVHADDRDTFLGFGDIIYNRDDSNNTKDEDDKTKRSVEFSEKTIHYYSARAESDGLRGYREFCNQKLLNLPHTGEELKSIAQNVFNGLKVRLFLREEASEKTVKMLSENGDLSRYKIIHFACHGKYDESIPQNSAVILAEYLDNYGNTKDSNDEIEYDGWLDMNDVAILNLQADMVTLSACETGLGTLVRGDGIVGLTRAFMVAGANNVASTLWSIHDKSTKDFMVSMYDKVKNKNQTLKEAFRNTKLEFIKSKDYNYPYYWAGFVLWGA
ncbi:MAG: tetratricopeptide repeat protein [Spirochaetes bacterium]|nr:tetratricopeptide repeat protein [Spirochaetota bacterium]